MTILDECSAANPDEESLPAAPPALSRRERQVLVLIARGESTAEIGQSLGISYHTADTHIKHIYRKLGVRSRAAAVSEGVRQGLIGVD